MCTKLKKMSTFFVFTMTKSYPLESHSVPVTSLIFPSSLLQVVNKLEQAVRTQLVDVLLKDVLHAMRFLQAMRFFNNPILKCSSVLVSTTP